MYMHVYAHTLCTGIHQAGLQCSIDILFSAKLGKRQNHPSHEAHLNNLGQSSDSHISANADFCRAIMDALGDFWWHRRSIHNAAPQPVLVYNDFTQLLDWNTLGLWNGQNHKHCHKQDPSYKEEIDQRRQVSQGMSYQCNAPQAHSLHVLALTALVQAPPAKKRNVPHLREHSSVKNTWPMKKVNKKLKKVLILRGRQTTRGQ